jgi:hypothetical protein
MKEGRSLSLPETRVQCGFNVQQTSTMTHIRIGSYVHRMYKDRPLGCKINHNKWPSLNTVFLHMSQRHAHTITLPLRHMS